MFEEKRALKGKLNLPEMLINRRQRVNNTNSLIKKMKELGNMNKKNS